MLAALARALRLSRDERDHLYRLADRPIPPSGGTADHVHPGMLDLLSHLEPTTPAMVITDLHAVLLQNPLAVAMLGDLSVHRGRSARTARGEYVDLGDVDGAAGPRNGRGQRFEARAAACGEEAGAFTG